MGHLMFLKYGTRLLVHSTAAGNQSERESYDKLETPLCSLVANEDAGNLNFAGYV
jgi:hypothetical protein